MRQQFVVGLAFNEARDRVLMIHKRTGPECVIGNWNGLGGKINTGMMRQDDGSEILVTRETPAEAMAREFEEECGLRTHAHRWHQFAVLHADDYDLWFFFAYGVPLDLAETKEDEPVYAWKIGDLLARSDVMPNMRWMIPFLLDDDMKKDLGQLRIFR